MRCSIMLLHKWVRTLGFFWDKKVLCGVRAWRGVEKEWMKGTERMTMRMKDGPGGSWVCCQHRPRAGGRVGVLKHSQCHRVVCCHRSFMATLDEDWGGFGHRASVTVYGGLDTWSLSRDLQWDLEYHVVFEPQCLSASRAGQLFFSMIFCTSDRALLPSTMWSASWAQDYNLHGTNFLLTQNSSEKEITWLHWLGMSSSKRAIHE